ncbi:MAG: hypothetical protein VR72_15870 [Clostridiaceae bacterium BRH_c20a]|nr:MAG: hypothetical protein VR72_15870 [Clostridiaceae bacterium BRH_c20a]
MSNAWGLIETIGLPVAVEAADAAIKSADVKLLGIELTNGGGLVVVKLLGDVGAIMAAVSSGAKAGEKVGKVWATHVIPRPNSGIKAVFYEKVDIITEKGIPLTKINITDIKKESEEISENEASCNLCSDPLCPRKKGDPKVNCINLEK